MAVLAYIASSESLLTEQGLVAWCLIGSFGGAIISLTIWPPMSKDDRWESRRLYAKIAASFSSGLIFSPCVIEYTNMSRSYSSALAVSGAIASVGVYLLHKLMPIAEQALAARAKKRLGVTDDSEPDRSRG